MKSEGSKCRKLLSRQLDRPRSTSGTAITDAEDREYGIRYGNTLRKRLDPSLVEPQEVKGVEAATVCVKQCHKRRQPLIYTRTPIEGHLHLSGA